MPSYRRDRPGGERPSGAPGPRPGRPSSFRRQEEEEPQFRRPSMLRREGAPGAPSEYASRPVGPSERRELWEVLVPKSEQEDPYFDYSRVFEILRPGRGSIPAPRGYEGPRAEAPRGAERGSQRPAREPGAPPLLDAGQFFDLSRIWNAAMTLKHDPRFKVGSPVAVVRTAPQAEVHKFFRIQPGDVAPFLDELSYSLNGVKPRELPGRFLFQRGADGFVWLAYVE